MENKLSQYHDNIICRLPYSVSILLCCISMFYIFFIVLPCCMCMLSIFNSSSVSNVYATLYILFNTLWLCLCLINIFHLPIKSNDCNKKKILDFWFICPEMYSCHNTILMPCGFLSHSWIQTYYQHKSVNLLFSIKILRSQILRHLLQFMLSFVVFYLSVCSVVIVFGLNLCC
jgi:hypothetical protein